MNKPLVIANWKATNKIKEAIEWVKKAKPELEKANHADTIICPPFTSLPIVSSLFHNSVIKVGAQDVSKFKKGAYTGEVSVEMLDGLVQYCIIGHSERRKYFGEGDDDVIAKVKLLLENKINPILCVSDINQIESYLDRGEEIIEAAEKIIFVYEPPSAISGGGTYRPEDPETANKNAEEIGKKIGKRITTLYGGSVNPDNVYTFLSQKNIDGTLVGQASTDPVIFSKLLASIKIVA